MTGGHLADERGRLAAVSALAILDTEPESEYDHITELARTVIGAPVAAVSIIAADRQWFKSIQGLEIRESARGDSFCSVTIQRPEPMIVEDAANHPAFRDNVLVVRDPGIRSYLGIPLSLPDGRQVGALCVIDFRPRSFTEREVSALRNLARCVEKEFALRLKTTVDGLTGCLCRQSFFDRVERALGWVRSGRTEAVLAILDLDHFKRINDTFGHDAGDAVLTAAAEAMMREFAGSGEVGRVGGEEFAVLFPALGVQDAKAALEAARKGIAGLSFPAFPGLAVTTSGGLSPLRAPDADAIDAFRRADVALYRAKSGGRNRIELSRDDADLAPPSSHDVEAPVGSRTGDAEPHRRAAH